MERNSYSCVTRQEDHDPILCPRTQEFINQLLAKTWEEVVVLCLVKNKDNSLNFVGEPFDSINVVMGTTYNVSKSQMQQIKDRSIDPREVAENLLTPICIGGST